MIFIQMKQKTTKQKERKHFLLVTQNKGEQIYEDQTDLFKFVQKDLNFGCAGKKKKKKNQSLLFPTTQLFEFKYSII